MLTTLQQAARRGCRIVSINPLAEVALSRFRLLFTRIGGDSHD
jgi:hypothetical protein